MSVISLEPEKEKALVEKAAKDKSKFTPLYIHYKKHIFDFFVYRVNTKEAAEDLTSKTFEKALKGIGNFQWQGISFSAWLYRIARNTLIDHYRESTKRASTGSLDQTNEIASLEDSPLEKVENMFSQEILYKILKELPFKEKEIIYMKFFEGYTNRTIAKLTGLSETNVGTIIYRTIRRLREMYNEEFN